MTTLFLILSASAVYFAIVSGTLRSVEDDEDCHEALEAENDL